MGTRYKFTNQLDAYYENNIMKMMKLNKDEVIVKCTGYQIKIGNQIMPF
jgi:hypothetical protein